MSEKTNTILFNPKILKQCREQMGLTIEDAESKASLKTLHAIEKGERQASFRQIDKLSQLYLVPRWVFTQETLPDKYNFKKSTASFRTFKNNKGNKFNYDLRRIVARVEDLREIIISFLKEMEEPVPDFTPPKINLRGPNIEEVSRKIYEWLNTNNEQSYTFRDWRKKLEDKGVFIFVTGSFRGWTKVEPNIFRGLSIYYEQLPIIIINASDAYKAKSFTLFHELGHLLMKKTRIDPSVGKAHFGEEQLCDHFAGNMLMPENRIKKEAGKLDIIKGREVILEAVSKVSKKFKTSDFATLVRLRALRLIDQKTYHSLESSLNRKYEESIKSGNMQRISRVMDREARHQYGNIYSNTVIQAYLNKHITLHRMRNMFGLKKTEYALKMIKAAI